MNRKLGIALICLMLVVAGFIVATATGGTADYSPGPVYEEVNERPKTAAELRADLLATEQASPQEYLDVDGRYWRNLIEQLVVEGDIANNASLAGYKDPVVTILWFSKTGTQIGEESYRVYEFVKPGRKTHFKLKTNAPASVKSISMGITDATPLQ